MREEDEDFEKKRSGQSVIEIEHYGEGESRARTTRFGESKGRSMVCASLGDRGAVFGTQPSLDEDTDFLDEDDAQRLHGVTYHPLGNWSATPEWSAALPAGERCVGVCAGEDSSVFSKTHTYRSSKSTCFWGS